MRRVITGATGLIGKRLVEHWLEQNHTVVVVGRTTQHIEKVFGTRVEPLTWDNLTRESFQSAELVVNLAGANISGKRWNDAFKQEVLSSRVETTKKIAEILASLGSAAPHLYNASAVGIYGTQKQQCDELPHHVDEDTPIDCENPPDFLSRVACQWERAAQPAIDNQVRVTFVRFAVVLAKEGGALPQIVKPFKFFAGGEIGTGCQPFSWVAIDDVVRAFDFLFTHKNALGAFNIVAPDCVMQRMLAETIGKILHRPVLVPMPAFALKLLLGKEMATELLLEGQHVYPKRLLDLGFHFKYPHIESALRHILL